jgi:hypothetical protein
MKNSVFSLLLSGLFFTACTKDASFESQIVGHWHSVNVKVGGVDVTSTNSIVLVIEDTKEFDATITSTPLLGGTSSLSYTGDWIADEAKQDMTLKYDNGQEEKYDVSDVSSSSMRANVVVDGVRREFVFEKR